MQNKEFISYLLHREELQKGGSNWEYAAFHMPNLHRTDDRTTKLMFKAYDSGRSNPDLLLYPILFRLVNYWPSLREIDITQPFTPEFAYVFCRYLSPESLIYSPFSSTSYISPANRSGEVLFTMLDKMLRMKARVLETLEVCSPNDLVTFLSRYRTIGNISAVEITKDLLYIRNNGEGEKWTTPWRSIMVTVALNYIFGRLISTFLPKDVYYAEIDHLSHTLHIDDNYYTARALASFCRTVLRPAHRQAYTPESALAAAPSFAEFAESFNL